MRKVLDYVVYPSGEKTIVVEDDSVYGGAHHYFIKPSLGFSNGVAEYVSEIREMELQFVQKNDDGSMVAGLQSEQVAYILLDRAKKLNARFPSEFNERMIDGLNTFLKACEDRVKDRIDRGVMGELKK